MASYSAGSVATQVFSRITGISSAISGNLIDLSSGACIDIGNFIGTTIDCSNVPEKYFNAAVNLTAAYAIARIHGCGITFGMDGLSVSKGAPENMNFFVEQVNKSLARRPILYKKVFG